ncbi:MAG: CvpA family protein [Planctomycetota bacterium]
MSPYDILMLIIFIGAVMFGFWKGLAWQIASLSAIVVSYFVAINFRGQVAPMLGLEEPLDKFAAMLILFLGTSLVIWLIFGRIRATIKRMQLKSFDRQAGALVGALKGALLCMVVTMFSVTLLGSTARQYIIQSRSGHYIASAIDRATTVVPDELHAVIHPHIERYQQAWQEETDNNTNLVNNDQAGSTTTAPIIPASTGGTTNYSGGQPYSPAAGGNGNVYVNPNTAPPQGGYQDYRGTWQNSPYQQSGTYRNQPGDGGTQWQGQQTSGQPGYGQPQGGQYTGGQYQGGQNQGGQSQGGQSQGGQYQGGQIQGGGGQYQQQYGQPQGSTQGYGQPQSGNSGYGQPARQGGQPILTQGENGYPDINVRINSRDLLETGGEILRDGASQAIDRLLNDAGGNAGGN